MIERLIRENPLIDPKKIYIYGYCAGGVGTPGIIKTHPDSVETHEYPYEVNEINAAYEYLLAHLRENVEPDKSAHTKQILWNAPENPNAYAKREIYPYCEDSNGEKVGFLTVACGKYMWIPDEDFALFLKSLYDPQPHIFKKYATAF